MGDAQGGWPVGVPRRQGTGVSMFDRIGVKCFQIRFSDAAGWGLGAAVSKRTFCQPYPVHLARGAGEVNSGILY